MKHFSLSVAALACLLSTAGFAEDLATPYGSQTVAAMNGQSSRMANGSSHMPSEGPPIPPNRDIAIHSAHGCLPEGFSVQAEFLWWRAHIDDIDYALRSRNEPVPIFQPFPVTINTKKIEPDFEYDPGVRVAAGYDFGRDNWDVFLRWTYHYTKATDSVKNAPGAGVLDLQAIQDSYFLIATKVDVLEQAVPNFQNLVLGSGGSAQWQTRLNSLDFEMGYDYFFSHRFSVRPHMGLKAAWIDMHYNVKHDAAVIVHQGLTDPFANLSGRGKSDYWGVGPRFGLDSYLHIGWGFSLYAQLAGALLYGEYDAKYRVIYNNLSDDTLDDDITVKQDDFYRLRVMSQLAMGLEWGWCFSRDYFLSLHIGWETQYWWNQLEIPFFSTFQPDGDLTYSGLDVGARFDF